MFVANYNLENEKCVASIAENTVYINREHLSYSKLILPEQAATRK